MSSCEDVEKLLERVRREVSSLSDEIKDLREKRIKSLEEFFVKRVEELSKDLDRMYFEYKRSIEASTQSYLNQLSHFSKLLDEWDVKVRYRIDSLDKKIERIGVEGVVRSFSEKSDELLAKINLSLEKYLEGLKTRIDEAEKNIKEFERKIETLRRIEKIAEEDILKRFSKKADSLKSAMNDLLKSLREDLDVFHRSVVERTDDLDERIGSLRRELINMIKEINDIMNRFSKTVNEETAKIVKNVERVADMSSEMIRLRRGQRRLLTLIIFQMILQMIMMYLFFFR